MKILYKQSKDQGGSLARFGIENCYFKNLTFDHDQKAITKKAHHHTSFEIHMVINGQQEYLVNGKKHKISSGEFLLIYPNTEHAVAAFAQGTQKYSLTFNMKTDVLNKAVFGALTDVMESNISFIANETKLKKEFSYILIENRILEILIASLRLSGIAEKQVADADPQNDIIVLAKQYINDNIKTAISVKNVADYCYLSTKQLTRIFNKFEDMPPKEYIIKQRVKQIELLLLDPALSLKQISEEMNFNNEYCFNAFFKKYAGMPPGEYRKMVGKK